ncbi:hypothetical protein DFH29DRAFT_1081136 [Suillus ampliporus]|nr:hypothetical protein DFH29DRAFT_1081136 [Suillus ampliporus]
MKQFMYRVTRFQICGQQIYQTKNIVQCSIQRLRRWLVPLYSNDLQMMARSYLVIVIHHTNDIILRVQNIQISGLPGSGSSTKSRPIGIQCPPRQHYGQHYGHRVNRRYMLYLESQIKTDPSAFHNSMSLARKEIQHVLQFPQFEFKYCFDPERRERDDEVDADEDLHRFEDDEEDGFNARPTQANDAVDKFAR